MLDRGFLREYPRWVTRADDSVASGVILPLKGANELTLSGSKETDRVEIIARKASGETYRIYDELVPASP